MTPIRFYHWWIYRLFRATWNPILRDRPVMLDRFLSYMSDWGRPDNEDKS